MASTVRVQLPGDPTEAEYQKLRQAMEREGFVRTVTSTEGVTYDLPHAEYNYVGAAAKGDVLARAERAAVSAGYTAAKILVTMSDGRTWANLNKH